EQYGYFPDGAKEEPLISKNILSKQQISNRKAAFSKKRLLKNKIFWRVSLAFMLNILLISAVAAHVMPYLSSIGITRTTAGLVATALPLTSIAGRLSFGWFADRFNLRRVIMVGFTMTAIGMLLFGYIGTAGSGLIIPFLIVYGIGYGGLNPMRPSMIRLHFGRDNFGTTFGLLMSINLVGSVLGPIIAGRVFDHWGSYNNLWYAFASLSIIALVLIFTIRPETSADLA
ncbi:MAG: MFS transporter, partial [Candidatus Margulisiibacteriota bacterium]